jgi:hypothetical protein
MSEQPLDKIQENLRRLAAIADHDGVAYGRLRILENASSWYELQVAQKLGGYEALADTFKCFFLETFELSNSLGLTLTARVSEFYTWFVPRLVVHFDKLCAADVIARRGYPMAGYEILRNSLDAVILTSAALQQFVPWLRLDGLEPQTTKPFDMKAIKKLKKKTEQQVNERMIGGTSGLTPSTIEVLKNWNDQFDVEVHDARLSHTRYMRWMTGREVLSIGPRFVTDDPRLPSCDVQFANYMNRFLEIAWMAHRLLPMLQTRSVRFGEHWRARWSALDAIFNSFVFVLTAELGKPIGGAMVELVTVKFPFSVESRFPND